MVAGSGPTVFGLFPGPAGPPTRRRPRRRCAPPPGAVAAAPVGREYARAEAA